MGEYFREDESTLSILAHTLFWMLISVLIIVSIEDSKIKEQVQDVRERCGVGE